MTPSAEDLGRSWRTAALAAVAVVAPHGALEVQVVVPLAGPGGPELALPFDRTHLAHALRRSGRALVACWDSRLAERGWQPVAAAVRVAVEEDRDGGWIDEGLLDQELRCHPPSRALLDSPLLRREHWWYVPRWRVRVTGVDRVWSVARRDGPASGLLVWDGGLDADVVAVGAPEGWQAPTIPVRSLAGRDLAGAAGAAVLLASDVRTPELDHSAELRLTGGVRDGVLHVVDREGSPELGPPPSLWRRLRAERRRELACRRALARPTAG